MYLTRESLSFVVVAVFLSCSSCNLIRTTFTSGQIAVAPLLELSLAMTLRAADVSAEVLRGFRVHKSQNAATFAAMDTTQFKSSRSQSGKLWHRHS